MENKIKSVELEKVIGITSKELPVNSRKEIAFAGKSNVGKSSLINSLIGRRSYAHTSEHPGKTQTVNYYHVNQGVEQPDFAPDCYLVDLPGYGFAKTAISEKEKWGQMIENYLHHSEMLKTVFLLVDIRHEPSENDVLMHDWIASNGMEPVIIATKKDKINRSQLQKSINLIRTKLKVKSETPVIAFSALSKEGREEIWKVIDEQ
jgi:GTP-binding protein